MSPDRDRAAPGDEVSLPVAEQADAEASLHVAEQSDALEDPDPDEVPAADGADEADLETVAAQRDDYLEALRRVQADLENYKKRVIKQQTEHLERAAEDLVATLLPTLDACDSAILHGATEVEPIFASLLGTLEKEGLARMHPEGEEFDPTFHEAVLHEGGDGGETIVAEVIRSGYTWKGRVLRPAMVKVKG